MTAISVLATIATIIAVSIIVANHAVTSQAGAQ
jgi:hypothetical protein